MSVKERLIEYINYKQISKSAFEKSIGVSNAYVNSIRKSIQPDKVEKISKIYPDLNTGWLMTGSGIMLLDKTEQGCENIYKENQESNSLFINIKNDTPMDESKERAYLAYIKLLEKENEELRKSLNIKEKGII